MANREKAIADLIERRNFIGIELDEKYFDISEGRIKDAEIGKLHGAN